MTRTSATKAPRVSEAAISRSIMDYLAAEHIFALRMNSGTRIGSYKGKNWAIKMHEPGTADILAFKSEEVSLMRIGGPPGDHFCYNEDAILVRPLWLEVKAADGKQSDLQKSFQAQVEAEGHRYAVVRSIEDVREVLK
jgi:hypothetical protein